MTSEIDSFLEREHAEGKIDSEGVFTLDLLAARRKYREYLLTDPHRYVLRLVRAAVTSGATQIDIIANHHWVTVWMDSLPLSSEELPRIFDFVGGNASGPANLAVAVNASLALEPTRVVVAVRDEERNVKLVIQPQSGCFLEDIERGPRGTAVQVNHRGGGFWGFLRESQEQRLLHDEASYCPIPITLNGKLLQPEWSAVRSLSALRPVADSASVLALPPNYFWVDHHALEVRILADPTYPLASIGIRRAGRASAVLNYGVPSEMGILERCKVLFKLRCGKSKVPNHLQLVHSGQTLGTIVLNLPNSYYEVVADCSQFELDVTGETVVGSDEFRKWKDAVRDWAAAIERFLEFTYQKEDVDLGPGQGIVSGTVIALLFDTGIQGIHRLEDFSHFYPPVLAEMGAAPPPR